MPRSNLRAPWPIHFKFHRVIGIDGLTVCILYGEILNFHSRVMGLYSSNCGRFFVCLAVNWEPLGQFTSNFAVIGIDSLYWFLKKCFQFYKCSNSCLWCSCWWNLDFSFKSYGKESLYKYCMNVDDGRTCALGAAVYFNSNEPSPHYYSQVTQSSYHFISLLVSFRSKIIGN